MKCTYWLDSIFTSWSASKIKYISVLHYSFSIAGDWVHLILIYIFTIYIALPSLDSPTQISVSNEETTVVSLQVT